MQKKPAPEQRATLRQRVKTWAAGVDWRQTLLRAAVLIGAAGALLGLIYAAFGRAAPDLLPLLRSGDEEQIAQYLGQSSSAAGSSTPQPRRVARIP